MYLLTFFKSWVAILDNRVNEWDAGEGWDNYALNLKKTVCFLLILNTVQTGVHCRY